MQRESSEPRARGDSRLERAIVLELLGDGGRDGLSQVGLGEALGAEPAELEGALRALRTAGVLELKGGHVSPSPATWRLEELELIGI
jgi:DNA-binding Lrp family transcriptional regulator